jgi:hypothetical protein
MTRTFNAATIPPLGFEAGETARSPRVGSQTFRFVTGAATGYLDRWCEEALIEFAAMPAAAVGS